jgi:hypothetical protein
MLLNKFRLMEDDILGPQRSLPLWNCHDSESKVCTIVVLSICFKKYWKGHRKTKSIANLEKKSLGTR